MKIDRSWTYPAPATDVYAMICDEAFQQRKTDATSTDGGSIDIAERAAALTANAREKAMLLARAAAV